ncbi:MAG: phosphatidate cytidylyltransferase [Planctomycetaceae bacterium]
MLGWRLLISAVLIPLLLVLFRWDASIGDRAPVLLLICIGLSIRCCFELTQLLRTRAMQPSFGLTSAICVLTILAAWNHVRMPPVAGINGLLISVGWIGAALTAGFLVLMIYEAVRFVQPGHAMESLGANAVTILFCGGLVALTAQFRWFPTPQIGYFAIGSMIIAVKSGDIGAYSFGRLWGKRKLIPRLSPGKTWMGAVGAIVGSSLGGWLWLTFGGALFDEKPSAGSLLVVLGYGATMGLVGLIGDLCESLIKRDVGQKDSAALMPGFGGLLDLLDSVLFASPFALAWWARLPPAG